MNFEEHKKEVERLAKIVSDRYNRPAYAVDISRWGIDEPFSDPENDTIYRDSIEQLAKDTFIEDSISEPHYPNAPYGSIWDY
jgi:hypothetical protein